MMASPACMCCASFCTVASVGPPAGTMIQTARGGVSLAIKSSSEDDPVAPSPAKLLHRIGAEIGNDQLNVRRASAAASCWRPCVPNPTIPNCMSCSFCDAEIRQRDFPSSAGVPRRCRRSRLRRSQRILNMLKSFLNRCLQRCQARFQICCPDEPAARAARGRPEPGNRRAPAPLSPPRTCISAPGTGSSTESSQVICRNTPEFGPPL